MSRSTMGVFFLVIMIVLTSWIEFKPRHLPYQVAAAAATTATQLYKMSELPRESLNEKIILSQEQSIRKLNKLVQTLKKQLELCKAKNTNAVNDSRTSITELLSEIEHQ